MNTKILEQAKKLPIEEQLELVEALWDCISERGGVPPPTDAQQAELDRRIADLEQNPNDVGSWDEVKASALAQIGR